MNGEDIRTLMNLPSVTFHSFQQMERAHPLVSPGLLRVLMGFLENPHQSEWDSMVCPPEHPEQ